jgi:hypothetical protein
MVWALGRRHGPKAIRDAAITLIGHTTSGLVGWPPHYLYIFKLDRETMLIYHPLIRWRYWAGKQIKNLPLFVDYYPMPA